ncbi:cobalt ABC transporter permease [Alteribacter lacisalsi]|uniref:Cobalt ABC transporter permease n=1 Tax=Alteribacter lacisalsi TaxID=2045244 RepID=A0A2W0HE89_9BACI|nr:energy-coupling factor transporter transmembrane protein EcfT [Alteribacter lacisalsi]PYZ95625.1 cobalt ABC transporter permease [Alteribacter lacisalsi]
MKSMIMGQYVRRDSFIHRMDPRAKLAGLFLFLLVLFLANRPAALIPAFLFAALVFLATKVPVRYLLKGLKFIAIMVILLFLFRMLMTREGTVLFELTWLTVYEEGVRDGAVFAGRLFLLLVLATVLTLTTTPIELTDALERLFKPLQRLGLPAHELALTMSIALRFIPTLFTEMEKIMKAQTARGASFSNGSLVRRIKALVPLLVPLIIQSFRRAEELAVAMEARGYTGSEGRTRFRRMVLRPSDAWVLLLVALTGVCIFALRG